MFPGTTLKKTLTPSNYLSPDGVVRNNLLEDFEYGPKNIYDVSKGLSFKIWRIWTTGTSIFLSPANDPNDVTIITSDVNITEVSLAFSLVGQPFIAYKTTTQTKLYYYNPLSAGYETIVIGDATSPMLTHDNKDNRFTDHDVMLFYIRNLVVYYRLQKERFTIEHSSGVTVSKAYSRISNVGLTSDGRLRISIITEE